MPPTSANNELEGRSLNQQQNAQKVFSNLTLTAIPTQTPLLFPFSLAPSTCGICRGFRRLTFLLIKLHPQPRADCNRQRGFSWCLGGGRRCGSWHLGSGVGVGVEEALHHLQQLLPASSCPAHHDCSAECLSRAPVMAGQSVHPGGALADPGTSDTAQGQVSGWEKHGSVLYKKKQVMANTQMSLVGLSQYMDKEVIIVYSGVPES